MKCGTEVARYGANNPEGLRIFELPAPVCRLLGHSLPLRAIQEQY
jgi:hypothetical protein